jgi:hypothetical protein
MSPTTARRAAGLQRPGAVDSVLLNFTRNGVWVGKPTALAVEM